MRLARLGNTSNTDGTSTVKLVLVEVILCVRWCKVVGQRLEWLQLLHVLVGRRILGHSILRKLVIIASGRVVVRSGWPILRI